MSDPVAAHLSAEYEAIVARLCAFIRLPSVEADPACALRALLLRLPRRQDAESDAAYRAMPG